MKPLAVITGVGPGTGAAMARRFHAGGHQVRLTAANAQPRPLPCTRAWLIQTMP
jgi:NAD(P)-dependent dehydrogenase (short-subunit alcohol dehydrogenase family)